MEYDPERLLDALKKKLNLGSDAALSRALEIAPPLVSKMRHRTTPVGASMLIRMHEVSGLSIRELRDLLGDRRRQIRLNSVVWASTARMERSHAGNALGEFRAE